MTIADYLPLLGAVLGVVTCIAFIVLCSKGCDKEQEQCLARRD
jgi:hypothetical protein